MKKKGILMLAIGALLLSATGIGFAKKGHHPRGGGEGKKMKITIVKDDNGTISKSEDIIEIKSHGDVKKYLESQGINPEELTFIAGGGHKPGGVWVYNTGGKKGFHHGHMMMINTDEERSIDDKGAEKVMVKTMVISKDGEESDESEQTEIKIEKKVDENGEVTIHKWVNGEEVDPDTKIERPRVKMLEDGDEMTIEVQGNDGETKVVKIKKEMDVDGNVTVLKSVNGEEFEEVRRGGKHDVHVMKMRRGPSGFAARSADGSIMIIGVPVDDEGNTIERQKRNSKEELAIEEVKFFPNPSEGNFKISFNSDIEGPMSISIKDMSGKEVIRKEFNLKGGSFETEMELEEPTPGMYIVNIQQGEKSIQRKLVIH